MAERARSANAIQQLEALARSPRPFLRQANPKSGPGDVCGNVEGLQSAKATRPN